MSRYFAIFCLFALVLSACPDQGTITKRFSQVNPAAGVIVIIPAGEKWLFDLAVSPAYAGVRVLGELIFSDQMDVQLKTQHVTVDNGGIFTIGSCDCRYTHKAIIELQQVPDQNANPDGVGVKVIGCLPGGKINFFGQVIGPTWTNIASSVLTGATTLTVADPITWRVGDQIALAPTGQTQYQSDTNPWSWDDKSEELTITAINGQTITFTPALKWDHYGKIVNGVDMRAYVFFSLTFSSLIFSLSLFLSSSLLQIFSIFYFLFSFFSFHF